MNIQEQLQTLLAGAINISVFPLVAPQDAAFPRITYQRILSMNENVMQGNGSPPISQCRMQIDVWAKTYAQAQDLSDQVTTAMQGWSVQNVQISSRDLYEPEVKIYRMSMDYSIWHH